MFDLEVRSRRPPVFNDLRKRGLELTKSPNKSLGVTYDWYPGSRTLVSVNYVPRQGYHKELLSLRGFADIEDLLRNVDIEGFSANLADKLRRDKTLVPDQELADALDAKPGKLEQLLPHYRHLFALAKFSKGEPLYGTSISCKSTDSDVYAGMYGLAQVLASLFDGMVLDVVANTYGIPSPGSGPCLTRPSGSLSQKDLVLAMAAQVPWSEGPPKSI